MGWWGEEWLRVEERSLQTSQGEAGEHQTLVPWMLRELEEGGGGIKADSDVSCRLHRGQSRFKTRREEQEKLLLSVAFPLPFHLVWTREAQFNGAFLFAATLVIPAGGQRRELLGARPAISKHGAEAASACSTESAELARHLPCALPDAGVPGAWPLAHPGAVSKPNGTEKNSEGCVPRAEVGAWRTC